MEDGDVEYRALGEGVVYYQTYGDSLVNPWLNSAWTRSHHNLGQPNSSKGGIIIGQNPTPIHPWYHYN